jgi:O-antigen ligase
MSLAVLETLCFTALLLYVRAALKDKEQVPFYRVPGLFPLMLILLFMLLQVLPLPAILVRMISPAAYDMYARTLGVVGSLGFITLSVDVKATVQEFFRFAAYGAFYILTVQLLSDGKRFKRTVMTLAWLGACVAAYALVERFFSNGKIYWLFSIPEGNNHVGPYVYKNHYAGFIEMLFPIVFAAFHYYRPRFNYNSLRENLVEVLTQPHANVHILLGFSALLMVTSQFVSLSRGGIICLSVAIIFFIASSQFMVMSRTSGQRKSGVLVLFVCLVVLAVSWFDWATIFERFEDSVAQGITQVNGRQNFWRDSVEIIKDFPMTGAGFGSFGSVYPGYRTFPGDLAVDHAHSDMVELLVTGGIPGFILVSWFLCSVVCSSIVWFIKRKDSYFIYMFLGVFSGGVAIVLHSATDFNYYSNANGLYMVFLSGLLVSAAYTRVKAKGPTRLDIMERPPLWAMGVPCAVFLLAGLLFNVGMIRAQAVFKEIEHMVLDGRMSAEELEPISQKISSAVRFDPLEGKYRLSSALASQYGSTSHEAEEQFRTAIRLNPSQGETVQRFGRYYLATGEKEKGARLMTAGLDLGKSDMERHRHCASFLLHQGELEQGLSILQNAMEFDPSPENAKVCIAIMVDAGVSPERFEEAMPMAVRPHFVLADYFGKTGNPALEEVVEKNALDCLKRESRIETWMIVRYFKKRLSRGDEAGAFEILVLGLSYLPDDVEFLVQAGKLYEKHGIPYKALEVYKKVHVIDPDNMFAMERMESLESHR